jgi:phosphoserine phosphatase
MAIIILQGPRLSAELADEAARRLSGSVEAFPDHVRVHTARAPSSAALQELRDSTPFDINVLPENFDSSRTRLLITDMDSTLINIECIDEIADFIGKKPQVAAITEAAMRGELNFEQSLTKRVALLAGLEASALERVYAERLRPNPGAEHMIAGLQAHGIKIALVSGGFTYFTEKLKTRLGLDYARANTLEIIDGRLTGRVLGTIVGAEGKRAFLFELCQALGITTQQAAAMGDGANDLLMMNAAGLSIAYHAKPAVRAQAHTALNHCTLEGVLALLGASAA